MTASSSGDLVGAELVVDVGPVAHGGHFVARYEGRVLFVRHAVPGETVRVRITEAPSKGGGRFLRADAVEVLASSPDRVEPPCPLARPDGCGGCDFQHIALPAQRRLKAAVVAEQLSRLAGLDVDVEVEAVPGDQDGLRWRRRMQYVALPDGRRGLRKHRSHEIVVVDDCLIAAPDAREVRTRPGMRRAPAGTNVITEHVDLDGQIHPFDVDADGFWQVHPGAPQALVGAVLEQLAPRPGERVLDLYAGVGLFSAFLAEAVGATGEVVAVESDRRATEHAAGNLAEYGWASVVYGRVDTVLARSPHLQADVVVLDPPRTGAKRKVVEAAAALRPRAVAYVACDPAAFARDVSYFAERGYRLTALRAFDLFPMTHHVECVGLLERNE